MAYPIEQSIVHEGLSCVHRSASGNQLQKHHSEGEDIWFFGKFPTWSVFRSKISVRNKHDIKFRNSETWNCHEIIPPISFAWIRIWSRRPYPKVPMTRVETWVLTSEDNLASPKSATWKKKSDSLYQEQTHLKSQLWELGKRINLIYSQLDGNLNRVDFLDSNSRIQKAPIITLASNLRSKSIFAALMSRWMILGLPAHHITCKSQDSSSIHELYKPRIHLFTFRTHKILTVLMKVSQSLGRSQSNFQSCWPIHGRSSFPCKMWVIYKFKILQSPINKTKPHQSRLRIITYRANGTPKCYSEQIHKPAIFWSRWCNIPPRKQDVCDELGWLFQLLLEILALPAHFQL